VCRPVYVLVLAQTCFGVHHIFRLNVMGTQGQTSHTVLKMKGRHTCQSIRLVSSHQELLQVSIYAVMIYQTTQEFYRYLLMR